MIRSIDPRELPEAIAGLVLKEWRDVVRREDRAMTYEECAWYYCYTYQTIRHHVCKRKIRTVGGWPNRRITHRAMRDFLHGKKKVGTPRKAMKGAQAVIA